MVSAAAALGFDRLAIASTGNAAASTAAYAAREGLDLTVLVPEWCEEGKLWSIAAHGCEIEKVAGGFDVVESKYHELVARGWFPAGSDNPYRTEGTKTLAYEIFQQTGRGRLDRVILPIGTGGLMTSVAKGFSELVASGLMKRLPVLDGVRTDSVPPLEEVVGSSRAYQAQQSVAGGINIARPMLAAEAIGAIDRARGTLHVVSDGEILDTQRNLALLEGVTAEPTGVVGVAAYSKALRLGHIDPEEAVVTVISGSQKAPA